jgi:hypothetical protein
VAGKIKIDLRKALRAIARAFQAANADRLLSGSSVDGGSIADRKTPAAASSSRKRVRILGGVRVKLAELAGRVGIASGLMLKDLTRSSNARIGRTSFKIVPSPEVMRRFFAFTAGSKHQTDRPISGVSDTELRDARDQVAEEGRAQIVAQINAGIRDGRRR